MENKRIVVFGGTFNPLSRAHGDLIRYLVKHLKCEKGILLPTGNVFFHSWKNFQEKEIIPLSIRLEILNEYKKRNKNIDIELIEVEGKTYKTYDSLTYLKEKYPGYKILFAFGSEKADELDRWYRIEDILKEFKIVLIRRNFDNLDQLFNEKDIFKNFKDSYILVDSKDSLQDISSTKIREAIKRKDKESLKKLTYTYVINLLEKEGYL